MVLNLVIMLNASIPLNITQIKNTSERERSASYLDLNKTGCRTKLYKRDEIDFPIVNFPCLSSNISVAPASGVYISQSIRYSKACAFYKDFIGREMFLTRTLLNQGFLRERLKSSPWKFFMICLTCTTDQFH